MLWAYAHFLNDCHIFFVRKHRMLYHLVSSMMICRSFHFSFIVAGSFNLFISNYFGMGLLAVFINSFWVHMFTLFTNPGFCGCMFVWCVYSNEEAIFNVNRIVAMWNFLQFDRYNSSHFKEWVSNFPYSTTVCKIEFPKTCPPAVTRTHDYITESMPNYTR